MQSAEALVEAGRKARDAGRVEEALGFYIRAVEAFEREGNGVRAEHSRRHVADLELESGRWEDARRSIGTVITFYREHGTRTLELGNTLRIAALAETAAGGKEEARGYWMETLACYEEVGVQAGVEECRRRLGEWAVS